MSFPLSYAAATIELPFPQEWLPSPAYLVGGAVRDWLLEHELGQKAPGTTKLDLDLVLSNTPLDWAASIARKLKGGFVVLDADRQIARIVLEEATVDLALQAGQTLEADLLQRDFTCNAIALELHCRKWIDPLKGYQDILERRLRMVHPDNLTADPLRLLRAYRQAAQLRFTLESGTRQAIRQRTHLLQQVAGERVRTEISYLLALGHSGLYWLEAAWQDGVLQNWLPTVSGQSFEQAHQVMALADHLKDRYPRTLAELDQLLSDQRSILMTVVLAALLQGSTASAHQIDTQLDRLKYSRAERHCIQKLHSCLPQFQDLLSRSPTAAESYLYYQMSGSLFPGTALLALATGSPLETLTCWLTCYEDPQDPIAHLVPLMDGNQLMQALGHRPGPWVGKVLAATRLAQATGEINSLEQAIAFAARWKADHDKN